MKLKKEELREIIKQTILEETAYEQFFRSMLKEYDVNSPAELSADKKKEFFSRIKTEWSAKKESVNEATNIQKTLGKDLANTLKVSPASLSFGAGGFAPKRTKDGNVLVVIGLDTKVKRISLPQADFFGKEITYGGYLVVKVNPNTGNLIKILGRYESPKDISLAKYVSESVNESLEPGDVLKHKHVPGISIELVEPTAKGWKVKQTGDGRPGRGKKKPKIAYFDSIDIEGPRSQFVKESVNEAKGDIWYIEVWDEDGDAETVKRYDTFDQKQMQKDFDKFVRKTEDGEEVHFMRDSKKHVGEYILSVVNDGGKHKLELTRGNKVYYKPYKMTGLTEESVNEKEMTESKDKYVVVSLSPRGGGFLMTKPTTKQKAEKYAKDFPAPKGETQKVMTVDDARKIKHLVGSEDLTESKDELKKLEDAIKIFQDKIAKQGRITNARDEEHLERLIDLYKQMGGKRIKEDIIESVDSLGYWKDPQDFRDEFINRYARKLKIKGWAVSEDDMTGTFCWNNPKSDKVVMATPFWEGQANIPVNVMDDETGEDLIDTSIPLKATKNFDKDAKEYIKKITQLFGKLRL